MIDIKRMKKIIRIIILFVLLILMFKAVGIVYSRYESLASAKTNVDIACFVLNETSQNFNLNLGEIVPRNEPYVYSFSIANYDVQKQADVDLQYDLSIKTTLNIPLRYNLYMNQTYNANDAEDIIVNTSTITDEYGTYFKVMETDTVQMLYTERKQNLYYLVVYFPIEYNTIDYQHVIESVDVIVDSKQII